MNFEFDLIAVIRSYKKMYKKTAKIHAHIHMSKQEVNIVFKI